MKKLLMAGATCFCAIALARIGGPDFTYVTPKMQDYNLVIDFTVNGLTPGDMSNFAVMGKAKAVYACIEKGDPNGKKATEQKVIAKTQYMEGQFKVTSEGWTRQLLALDPPVLPGDQQCGNPDHRSVLAAIEYRDVVVMNLDTHQIYKVKGRFSKVFFNVE